MKGSPAKMGTISGTAGHRSALKMKAASALKETEPETRETSWWRGEEGWIPDELQSNVKRDRVPVEKKKEEGTETETKKTTKKDDKMPDADWKKGQETAKSKGENLDALVKKRKGLEKGSDEWKRNQNKINEALGNKKRYKTSATGDQDYGPDHKDPGYDKFMEKHSNIEAKADKKKEKHKAKYERKSGETDEDTSKKLSKLVRKTQKKTHGKGSKKHQQAKLAHLKAKEADRQGTEGGRKQGLFRKLSSKINLKRQKKTEAKIKAMEDKA